MSDIFYVLADATRREILQALIPKNGDACEKRVSELVEELEINQPTVSKHLKILRDAEVVNVREDGASRFYSLNAEPFNEAEDFILQFLVAEVDTEISVEYLSASGESLGYVERIGRAETEPVLRGKTISAAESVGRAAAKATEPVKELVARFKLRG